MNEHSFDAFSLKMKESVKKKCRSAPRDKILSVKVDDLTGYETCQTNDMGMRCGHVRMSRGHMRMLCGYIRMYKVREFGNLNAKCIYTHKRIATMFIPLVTKSHVHNVKFSRIWTLDI